MTRSLFRKLIKDYIEKIYIYSMYEHHWKGRHEKTKWNKKMEAWEEEDSRKDLGYDDD